MVLVPVLALAMAAASSTPTEVVKKGNDEVQKILKSENGTVEKLAAKADEFIDFPELAKRALGDEWPKLNKKQQGEFSDTMKGLLRASYAQRAVQEGKGGSDIGYVGEKVDGNEATVSTTVALKKDKIPVDYKLFRTDPKSQWRIYDVITDESSLVTTYNDQFRQVISKKGYDGLLATLKKRRDQIEAENKKPVGESKDAPKGGATGGSVNAKDVAAATKIVTKALTEPHSEE
jgi:phospholipid transport system substrate-binding protein